MGSINSSSALISSSVNTPNLQQPCDCPDTLHFRAQLPRFVPQFYSVFHQPWSLPGYQESGTGLKDNQLSPWYTDVPGLAPGTKEVKIPMKHSSHSSEENDPFWEAKWYDIRAWDWASDDRVDILPMPLKEWRKRKPCNLMESQFLHLWVKNRMTPKGWQEHPLGTKGFPPLSTHSSGISTLALTHLSSSSILGPPWGGCYE